MNDADHDREDVKVAAGTEYGLVASAGWCAPSEAVYDASLITSDLTMPEVIATMPGSLRWEVREPTEREKQERWAESWLAEHSRRHVAAHIGDIALAQHDAVHAAVYWARTQRLPWSVHVHTNSASRFVGITLWPSELGASMLRTHALYFDDSWGGGSFDAEDWCEMFEDR